MAVRPPCTSEIPWNVLSPQVSARRSRQYPSGWNRLARLDLWVLAARLSKSVSHFVTVRFRFSSVNFKLLIGNSLALIPAQAATHGGTLARLTLRRPVPGGKLEFLELKTGRHRAAAQV